MAASAQWQPQEEGFKEICSLVEQQISPSSDKSKIWQQPQHYSQFPDFNNYLAFIFARAESKSVEVRQAAGLLLKNNLKAAFKAMPASNQEYIKSELLPCLGAGDRQIWSTAGTIISVLVQLEGVFGWPELLHTLVKCLDSNDLNHMEGALDALSKICEDIPQVLDSETLELSERPINIFLPRLLQFFQSPHASLRKLSLGSVNQYIMLMPTVLYISMDKFLQGLFVLANDPAAEVRKLVCAAFVQLIEVRPAFLEWRSQDPQPVGVKIWRGFEGSAPEGVGLREGHERFDKVLMGLLQRILDNNKRVQEAACSAFTTLEEEAAEELVPRLDVILQHLMCAFGKYQRRNLRIVYDAIGTLADAVGAELNQPMYLDVLMPPLIAKWQQLSNADKDLFPLLECYTSIAQALGTGFSQFAQPVFQRCINIIQTQHLAKVDPSSAGVQYDKEFVVCSLDLLSGLTEGLGSGIKSLILQSNLRDLLLQCCMDDAPDIRQGAFALLGDLARVCPIHLHQRLPECLDVASKQLSTPKLKENVSVANNACWAIGELAIKVRQEIFPIVMTVISSLVPILQHVEGLNKSLIENSSITLGRLAWVCPELVSPHMEHFMQSWCIALSMIRDDIEKEDAFRGLCAIAPYAFRTSKLIQEIRSEELRNEVCQVFLGYKQMLSNGAWEQCMSSLEPPVKEKLSKYQV